MPINQSVIGGTHASNVFVPSNINSPAQSLTERMDSMLPTAKNYMSGYKNKIINGNFAVNQRTVSGTVTLAAGVYGHDRWKAGASGCTYTFATVENVTTITITAGSLLQIIEGLNLFTGTHILSWQGTAQGKIGAGSYGTSGLTGIVTGGTNINIEFGVGTLKLAQLEQGSVATPFEVLDYGDVLRKCQRYYEVGRCTLNGYSVTGMTNEISIPFKVTKSGSPTLIYAPTNYVNVSEFDIRLPYGDSFIIHTVATSTGGYVFIATWSANAEL
jgi:hypothetical protein